MDISNTLVVGMGIGIVFIGLVSLILICYIMGLLCNAFGKKSVTTKNEKAEPVKDTPIQNKQEIIAAVTCAIAEELGADVKGIRVKSFRRI